MGNSTGRPAGTICWIHPRDYDHCAEIDLAAGIEPWTRNDWRTRLDDPDAKAMTYYLRPLKNWQTTCVGYVFYSVFGQSLSIERLVVHPKCRRMRIGSELMDKAISLGTASGRKPKSLITIVHECDVVTQCFLRHHEFTVTRTLHKFFQHDGRDAYAFERPSNQKHQEAAGCRGR